MYRTAVRITLSLLVLCGVIGAWYGTDLLERAAIAKALVEPGPLPATGRSELRPAPIRRRPANRPPAPRLMGVAPEFTPAPAQPEVGPADRLLAALPAKPGSFAVMVEMSSLWNRPIGDKMRECLERRAATGVDKVSDSEKKLEMLGSIDRFAVARTGFALSGNFSKELQADLFENTTSESHGHNGRLIGRQRRDGTMRIKGAMIGDEVIINELRSREAYEAAIDQLEGRATQPRPSPIPESAQYGDVYGVVPGVLVEGVLSSLPLGIGKMMQGGIDSATFSVDATHDLVLTIEIRGKRRDLLGHLASVLSTTLSLVPNDKLPRPLRGLGESIAQGEIQHRGDVVQMQFTATPDQLVRSVPECRRVM